MMRLVELPPAVFAMIVERACISAERGPCNNGHCPCDSGYQHEFATRLAVVCKKVKAAVDPQREVRIWRDSALTDVDFLRGQARKCELVMCHGITNRALAGLRHVHTVKICGGDDVTDVSVLGTGTIQNLELSYLKNATAGLAAISSVPTVRISDCNQLRGFGVLGRHPTNIIDLDLTFCDGLNDEDLVELATIPKLQLLWNKGISANVTDLSPLGQGGVHDLSLGVPACFLSEEKLWPLRCVPELTFWYVPHQKLPERFWDYRGRNNLPTTIM